MTDSTSISLFCQWLLAQTSGENPACTIVLHGDDDIANDSLILAITEYLNEYDSDGEGLWLNATGELLKKITEDPSHLRLLGIDPDASRQPDVVPKVLSALSKRGHMVCLANNGSEAGPDTPDTFHAGISRGAIGKRCHIILDPELILSECLPQIIADVFLEWMNCKNRPQQPIRKIR